MAELQKRRMKTCDYLKPMAQDWQALFLVHMPLSKASHKAKAKPNIKEVGKTALPAFLNHGKGGGKEEL